MPILLLANWGQGMRQSLLKFGNISSHKATITCHVQTRNVCLLSQCSLLWVNNNITKQFSHMNRVKVGWYYLFIHTAHDNRTVRRVKHSIWKYVNNFTINSQFVFNDCIPTMCSSLYGKDITQRFDITFIGILVNLIVVPTHIATRVTEKMWCNK